MVIKRDNFTPAQKQACRKSNAEQVRMLWREEFGTKTQPHYMCEHCRFVSPNESYFEVDHLVSCEQGGTANRMAVEKIAALEAELAKPLDRQDIGVIANANLNAQLLCHGCNQGKKGSRDQPDQIPAGCGFAWAKRDEDMNPEHRYAGPPHISGYVKPRYRKNVSGKS